MYFFDEIHCTGILDWTRQIDLFCFYLVAPQTLNKKMYKMSKSYRRERNC
jgi:hypothetical protein